VAARPHPTKGTGMTHTAPHDLSDLLLAPLALRLDRELEELAGLTAQELHYRVCLETDSDPHNGDQRRRLLLEMLGRFLNTHEWELSWEERGLALIHDDHRLVLGIPANIRAFLLDGRTPTTSEGAR
jgi:hypothetical protein